MRTWRLIKGVWNIHTHTFWAFLEILGDCWREKSVKNLPEELGCLALSYLLYWYLVLTNE